MLDGLIFLCSNMKQECTWSNGNLLYVKTQLELHSKHLPSRLQKKNQLLLCREMTTVISTYISTYSYETHKYTPWE